MAASDQTHELELWVDIEPAGEDGQDVVAIVVSGTRPERTCWGQRIPIGLDLSRFPSHGVAQIPLPFPRFLQPKWSEREWRAFLKNHGGAVVAALREYLIQILSLAVAHDERKEIVAQSELVVLDVRGALYGKYLSKQDEGFKIGVFRYGHDWPIWLDIKPTWDLAIGSAKEIANEANLPQSAIRFVGHATAMARFHKEFPPLVSEKAVLPGLGLLCAMLFVLGLGVGVGIGAMIWSSLFGA